MKAETLRRALRRLLRRRGGAADSASEWHSDQPSYAQAIPFQQHGRVEKIAGVDYKRHAVAYADKLTSAEFHYLYTKPFYNIAEKIPTQLFDGLRDEAHRHFCDFANIAYTLRLSESCRILDVGCGPGWLSEYLARLGYDVTGTDISPDLIRVARERLSRVGFGVDNITPLRCRFVVHDIEQVPLADSSGKTKLFDLIICYDSLHHFEDERAVMRHLSAMLSEGGLLFILEGERPAPGSAGERELIEVMREYGTLESPYTREYLIELLAAHDFRVIGDFISVNGLFEREMLDDNRRLPVTPPALNYLLCKKLTRRNGARPVPDSRSPGVLQATIEVTGAWQEEVSPGALKQASLKVTNTGDTLWLVGAQLRAGIVSFGIKLLDDAEKVVDERHNEPPLPRALAPGETATVTLAYTAPTAPGRYTLKIDLIDHHICWFETRGSHTLALPLVVHRL